MNMPVFAYTNESSLARHGYVMSHVNAQVTPMQHGLLHKQVSLCNIFFLRSGKQKVREEYSYIHRHVGDHVALWKSKNYT